MIYLSDHSDRNTPITLREVASEQGLPYKYLEQLATTLKNVGLIKSIQGKQGGYVLARPAEDITALDIVKASMGPIDLLACISPSADCNYKEVCASRKMWGLIETRINDILTEYTLVDLSEKRMLDIYKDQTGDETAQLKCT